MLVLTRKSGESIRIGNDIELIIRRISGTRVTLAIEAPRDVSILRGELESFDEIYDREPARKTQTRSRCGREPYVVVEGHMARDAIPAMVDSLID
ncbi:MAG: carbon storage regulator [Pirellulales bacterium]|nr:carbon storage regulator [Pirellulales bacterium]